MTRTSPHFHVRRTAYDREERRIRIMGMVRAGLSYEAVAREENLSRERIRQIVTKSLHAEDGATRIDPSRLQMARLEPALRLAARGVESGKLQAIGPLLKVMERLDKYGAVVVMNASQTAGMRERLLKKLDAVAARMNITYPAKAEDVADEASSEAGPGAAGGDPDERKNLAPEKMGWTDL